MSAMFDPHTLTAQVPQTAPGLFALLREDIACVFQRDPAARTTWEVITTYPGIHALFWHRLSHVLWGRRWRYAARFISFFARMFTQIDIHPGATIGRRFFIDHGCGVVIGETAEVGNDVTLYHGVTLGGVSWNPGKRHPTLCDGVVVGAGAKILGPITVGSGARVGANSVVIQDVPDSMTVVGIPGRVVLPANQRRITQQGIDLDHHLMPDPVGKAISCLLDRIAYLEKHLGVSAEAQELPVTSDCITCTETCDPAHVAVNLKRTTH
ncbi:serine acetyltransferase [Sulfuriferula multivorans]|uniref:Serine acetyltransferase n=1 Tax=Sulfuriferula multivorans TaxID=1559896 RepID=A0A401JCB3_9PROT|nr:serine O-acetyltransferase [Sulfuriferula multivorans]GBL45180.1 serine acetyltransferase [Sulfuriferula multivorans]